MGDSGGTAAFDNAPFVIPGRKELADWFEQEGYAQSDESEQAKIFFSFAKKLVKHWTPLLVSSGVVGFACDACKRFALDAHSTSVALNLLSLVASVAPKSQEAHAQLVLSGAAQTAISCAKAHPYEAAVQQHSLEVVAAIHDDAVRRACSSLGLGKSAVQACSEHRFEPEMSAVRKRGDLCLSCSARDWLPRTHQGIVHIDEPTGACARAARGPVNPCL